MALNDVITTALAQLGYSGSLNEKEALFYSNIVTLLQNIAKTPTIIAQSGVAASITGSLSPTTLASIVIPANTISINGSLRITTLWSYTNSANAKILSATFGGTSFMGVTQSTTAGLQYQTLIRNRGVANSQVGYAMSAGAAFTATGSAATTGTLNTAQDQTLNIIGTLANVSEVITLESYTIEVLNP